jgi:hypothetical protein
LDAGRGERDAEDTVDQAQATPRCPSRRREADNQDSRDHCDRQNQFYQKEGGRPPGRCSQPDQSERQAGHEEAGKDPAEDRGLGDVPHCCSSPVMTACCKILSATIDASPAVQLLTNGSKL